MNSILAIETTNLSTIVEIAHRRDDLKAWVATEPQRLLTEIRDLRLAKQSAELKLARIEKRLSSRKRRLREIRGGSAQL
jgi:hypothetical protein